MSGNAKVSEGHLPRSTVPTMVIAGGVNAQKTYSGQRWSSNLVTSGTEDGERGTLDPADKESREQVDH